MPIKDMPAFLMAHKNVRYAVYYSLTTCAFLTLQLLFMNKNALNILFDIIIPFSGAIVFGCYAITMAMDRPVILICPPTVYFTSILINQLIRVEVGAEDTYPFFILAQLIPYVLFCISAATGKIKKISGIVLRIFCILITITSVIIALLPTIFSVILFSKNYISSTAGMICGFMAAFFIYMTMIELLKISGCEKVKK